MKVIELFAGVGGFRLGLEKASDKFKTVWFNQWEPNKKKQWAWECYVNHFGDCPNSNTDITQVNKEEIPNFDLLVGGFPCQPFSVSRTADKALGLEDLNKGQLWFQIRDILKIKKPKYVLLENVDRLLKSPAKQKGRDFGIILYQFNQLGYSVEWRVITASNYGNPQRRKRTFIFACKEDFKPFFNDEFPAFFNDNRIIKPMNKLPDSIQDFSFNFGNWGYMKNSYFHSEQVTEKEEQVVPLGKIIERERAYS